MAALGGSPGGCTVTTLFVHEACGLVDGASNGDAPPPPYALVPTAPRRETDGEDSGAPCEAGAQSRTLYTRDTLASALCLMGAKPRHSLKVAARVFDTLGVLARRLQLPGGQGGATATVGLRMLPHRLPRPVVRAATFVDGAAELPRPQFEALVAWALAEYQYAKPDQLEDLRLACRIHERRTAVFVLLCGTSGTGKSTLAALLAARMGISTIISTDFVRGVLRGSATESSCPLLFASTYQAGDLVAYSGEPHVDPDVVERKRTVKGYKAQSELVMTHLAQLLISCEARGESAVVEGVHLNLSLVLPLMARHPTLFPFLITISNESKHRERFAVRAKYMSLSPEANRYIRYFRQIRAIQDYLAIRATRFLVPRVNNTNVDRSVNTIHATAFGCLRRAAEGASLAEAGERAVLLNDEYRRNTLERGAWSSKSMLAMIRSRHERELASGAVSDAPSTSSSAITNLSSEEEREEMSVTPKRALAGHASAGHASASSDDEYPAAVVAASDGGRTDSEAGFHSEVGSIMDSQVSEEDGDDADGIAHRFSRLATLAEL